jgi:hypothetical protein
MTESKVPATLESVITERIKPIIGEMLPDDVLKKHVEAMIFNFTHAPDSYRVSPLGELINAELRQRSAAAIKKYLDENCQGMWGQDGLEPSTVVAETIKQTAPTLLAALFGGVVQGAVDRVKNEMQSMAQNRY